MTQKNKTRAWIQAARPRTLPLAVSSIITGSALAWNESMDNPVLILVLASITCILLQVMSNFANDYGDHTHGTDNAQRVGPMRAVQSGVITKQEMFRAIVITATMAFISGILLLYFSFRNAEGTLIPILFLLVGLAAIAAAYKYTAGKNPYGYRGLGDISVFLFFGITGVTGTYYLHIHQFTDPYVLMPAAAIGLFSAAVLNLNNMRDHMNDKSSGKITLVVQMGFQKSKWYHAILLLSGWILIVLFVMQWSAGYGKWLIMIPFPIMMLHLGKVFRNNEPKQLDGELKKVALSTFFFSLLLLIFILTDRMTVNIDH
jgi:1,4-dihydroxy-2-naphthoate octaprenyltransferase